MMQKGEKGESVPVTSVEHENDNEDMLEEGEILEWEEDKADKEGKEENTKCYHKGESPTRM